MDDGWLARQFEEHRPRLRAVATRLLGSGSEAEDAVQEVWLRLSRTDPGSVEILGGWLTTVVGRLALNMLRSRATRREEPLDGHPGADRPAAAPGPADTALLADSVGMALLVVLETLTPAERLAFVLHDLFDVPFDEIATVVDRSPAAARQLASRARRRVQGSSPGAEPDPGRRRAVVTAFLAASRGCDFAALLALHHLLRTCPCGADGPGRRRRARGLGSGRPAAGRIRLHDQRRERGRHRPARRPPTACGTSM